LGERLGHAVNAVREELVLCWVGHTTGSSRSPASLTGQDLILREQTRYFAIGSASDQQVADTGKHLVGRLFKGDGPAGAVSI
jgi:hypothetical protein